jgi:hypothetical protein
LRVAAHVHRPDGGRQGMPSAWVWLIAATPAPSASRRAAPPRWRRRCPRQLRMGVRNSLSGSSPTSCRRQSAIRPCRTRSPQRRQGTWAASGAAASPGGPRQARSPASGAGRRWRKPRPGRAGPPPRPSGAGGGGTAGRVVTGGHDGHMLARDPARDRTKLVQLGCSATALAAAPPATKGPAW